LNPIIGQELQETGRREDERVWGARGREEEPNSNEYLLAKIGVDTTENEPLEVWGNRKGEDP
jgi:hypothetical protein